MKSFDQKFAAAQSELAKTSIRPNSAYPPVLALLSKMGFQTRPPHYAPFIVAFNIAAIAFAGAWGGLMWLLSWSNAGMAPDRAMATAVITGVAFGFTMAFYYFHGRKKHGLTPWDKL